MCKVPTNRIHQLVCMATAGVAVVVMLALHAGSTAAATGTASASAREAAQGRVRIELRGRVLGARGNEGRFTLSGALSDRGRFVDAPGLYIARTLYGAKGTIRIGVGPRGAGGSPRERRHTPGFGGGERKAVSMTATFASR